MDNSTDDSGAFDAELLTVMKTERGLLGQFHHALNGLRERIVAKDWQGLDAFIRLMNAVSADLARVEEIREQAFARLASELDAPQGAVFYEVVSRLPDEQCEKLSAVYRDMKMSVIGIQAQSTCIEDYVQTFDHALHDVLNELLPHRKGTMYSRSGTKTDGSTDAVVVNRSL